MWLNIFKPPGNRPLSPIEVLALFSAGRTEYRSAKKIIEQMRKNSTKWSPEAGTVYPALHRLVDKGLLEKSPDKKTAFMISEKAYLFMTSLTEEIAVQLEESLNFFESIIEGIIDLNPFEAETIIDSVDETMTHWTQKFSDLKQKVNNEKSRGDWKSVDVEFK